MYACYHSVSAGAEPHRHMRKAFHGSVVFSLSILLSTPWTEGLRPLAIRLFCSLWILWILWHCGYCTTVILCFCAYMPLKPIWYIANSPHLMFPGEQFCERKSIDLEIKYYGHFDHKYWERRENERETVPFLKIAIPRCHIGSSATSTSSSSSTTSAHCLIALIPTSLSPFTTLPYRHRDIYLTCRGIIFFSFLFWLSLSSLVSRRIAV